MEKRVKEDLNSFLPLQLGHVLIALLAFKVFLAGHVVPDAVHLLRGDLVHGDHPAVATEAVGHLPVVEAAVLKGVDAQLTEAHTNVHVLQVQKPGVQGGFVYELSHVR